MTAQQVINQAFKDLALKDLGYIGDLNFHRDAFKMEWPETPMQCPLTSLRVWDGDTYYECDRIYNPLNSTVHFVCGKCRDSELKHPGDVCEFCWCVAVSQEKIGETINVKRPMRFSAHG